MARKTSGLSFRAFQALVLVAALAPAWFSIACDGPGALVQQATFRSKAYAIDRIHRSMMGPSARAIVRLGKPGPPELLWITGYRTRITRPDGSEAGSAEFMCHSNLGIANLPARRRILASSALATPRIFTLSQGQMEVRFPDGFGIPVVSGAPLTLDTMVLNLNPQPGPLEVVHETTVDYVRDADASDMQPLFQAAAQGMVSVSGDEPYYGVESPDPEVHGEGCMVGMPAAGEEPFRDPQGREFAAHWVVPPGRQTNRTLVTNWMAVPFDTTVHYIAVHVHPFAESLTLRDLDTGEVVFESRMRQSDGRIGLDHVDSFSSAEGIPIYAGHEYELVSVYDNPTDEAQDAMAIMFLYLRDAGFEKPQWAVSPPGPAPSGQTRLAVAASARIRGPDGLDPHRRDAVIEESDLRRGQTR